MYFDSICFMFATFEEGLMNPFKILLLKGGQWHFIACDLRRRRQLFFLQALVWQLPSLWLNPFSSLYKSTKYVLSWTDCFWIMNFLVPNWYKDHCDFFWSYVGLKFCKYISFFCTFDQSFLDENSARTVLYLVCNYFTYVPVSTYVV